MIMELTELTQSPFPPRSSSLLQKTLMDSHINVPILSDISKWNNDYFETLDFWGGSGKGRGRHVFRFQVLLQISSVIALFYICRVGQKLVHIGQNNFGGTWAFFRRSGYLTPNINITLFITNLMLNNFMLNNFFFFENQYFLRKLQKTVWRGRPNQGSSSELTLSPILKFC